MPLIYNGVTVTDVIYNGVALDKVIYNGVEVFTKAPIREPASGEYYLPYYLYPLSEQCTYNIFGGDPYLIWKD